jgi:hypothetical protein
MYSAGGWVLRVEGDQGPEGHAAVRHCDEGRRALRYRRYMGELEAAASGEWIRTFAIVTTDANELVAQISRPHADPPYISHRATVTSSATPRLGRCYDVMLAIDFAICDEPPSRSTANRMSFAMETWHDLRDLPMDRPPWVCRYAAAGSRGRSMRYDPVPRLRRPRVCTLL